MAKYRFKDIEKIRKETDHWFRRFLLQPFFALITWILANYTNVTPNMVSFSVLIFGIGAGYAFYKGYMILGAVLCLLRYAGDAVDGAIARLKKTENKFGAYMDNYMGMISGLPLMLGFGYGQLIRTGDGIWLILIVLFYFLSTIHSWEGVHFVNIAGGKYAFLKNANNKQKKKTNKKEKRHLIETLFQQTKEFLLKHRLRDPFNVKDVHTFVFIIGPLVPAYLKEFTIIGIIALAFNSLMWTCYYIYILKKS